MVHNPALVFGHRMQNAKSEEDSVLDVMRKFLCQISSSDESDVRRGSLESCDFVKERSSSIDSETTLDYEEKIFQDHMANQIERCLSDAKESYLRCQVLLLPRPLIFKVARDVVRSSQGEPCGFRGAFIKIYLETSPGLALQMLGTISTDLNVTPTFELSIVFKLDKEGWPPLKHIFVNRDKVLKLQPRYRLVKKKLYSSASPVIHEFN
ncbi:hypothetical protein UPYG_G00212590 [Umbra pygmaea]|uniref:DNA damage-inducible transcript 4-like protein n=1 Tax=Umbra pygmaea TaxID=75934 RepID=A0ABD0WKJ5_UMBPY